MVDFTTYQAPGVYIEEDLSSLVNVIGVRPTVVAIVGPSVGHRIGTETLVLSDETPVELSQLGVDTDSLQVAAADGTLYVLGDDYVVTEQPGEDANQGTEEDNTVEVARVINGDITSGDTVYVTYEYTDANYFAPLKVNDFDDVQDAYGSAIDIENGTIFSPLSFAALMAFENGANQLILVSTTGARDGVVTRQELTDAYTKLTTMYEVGVVVPLARGVTGTDVAPGDTTGVATDLRTHLTTMSTNGLFRVGVLGFERTATISPIDVAANVSSSRLMLAWPNRLNYYHGFTNTIIEVSGYYLAAAYAGRIASLPVQSPLTKKRIYGFSGIPADLAQTMTLAQKNDWSQNGVAVAEITRDGRMVVRHGTTTDRTNLQSRELSLIRAKDALINLLQETVDAAELVGTYIDEDTPGKIKGVISGVLETAKGTGVIIDYNNLKIRQLTVDPSVMEVKFQYQPAYPLNYIVISFSINTQTGETTFIDLAEQEGLV